MMEQVSTHAVEEWKQRAQSTALLRDALVNTCTMVRALTSDLREVRDPATVQEIIRRIEAGIKNVKAAVQTEAGDEAMDTRWALLMETVVGGVTIATEAALHVTASEWEEITV